MYLGLASLPQYKDNGVLDWAWKQVIELEILTVKEEERLKNLPKGETARRPCKAEWCVTKQLCKIDMVFIVTQKE